MLLNTGECTALPEKPRWQPGSSVTNAPGHTRRILSRGIRYRTSDQRERALPSGSSNRVKGYALVTPPWR